MQLDAISCESLDALATDLKDIAQRTDEKRPPRERDGERIRDAVTAIYAYRSRIHRQGL